MAEEFWIDWRTVTQEAFQKMTAEEQWTLLLHARKSYEYQLNHSH